MAIELRDYQRESVHHTSYVVANRVDAIKAIGNGQVPAVAALAWRLLTEGQT